MNGYKVELEAKLHKVVNAKLIYEFEDEGEAKGFMDEIPDMKPMELYDKAADIIEFEEVELEKIEVFPDTLNLVEVKDSEAVDTIEDEDAQ